MYFTDRLQCIFMIITIMMCFSDLIGFADGASSNNSSGSTPAPSSHCIDGYFACNNGNCVPHLWICDGEEDCLGGEDEYQCDTEPVECAVGEWQCDNQHCVQDKFRCDGRDDCGDKSDEDSQRCETYKQYCPDGMFHCSHNTAVCIPFAKMCDGQVNCPDGEDEYLCNLPAPTCSPQEFRCQDSGICISASWLCDSQNDCEDGSDETEVMCLWRSSPSPAHSILPSVCGAELEFQCHTGECFPLENVCDGVPHCTDSSDEGDQCATACQVNQGGCSHICHPTPGGAVCECLQGYNLLLDGKTCNDINECQDLPHACSQICINQPGSYDCHCDDGYQLEPNGKSCKALGSRPSLIIENLNELRWLDVDNRHYGVLASEAKMHQIQAFALDISVKDTYVATAETTVIDRFTNDGHITTVLKHVQSCQSLAVDWFTHNLYYIDSIPQIIAVCRVEAEQCADVVSGNMVRPTSLVLDPLAGLMFWSDWGDNARIESTSMDGSNRQIIIHHHLIWPNSITLDLVRKRVYWVDAKLNTIESSDYYGLDRVLLLESDSLHSYGITMFEDFLYWTDTYTGQVNRVNKFTGDDITMLAHNMSHPRQIEVFHDLAQPTSGINWCERMQKPCSQLCLLKPGGATCKCSKGMEVSMTDHTQCRPEVTASTTLTPVIAEETTANDTGCPPEFCYNNGTCLVINGTSTCSCPVNFSGSKCNNETSSSEYPGLLAANSYVWVVGLVIVVVLSIISVIMAVCCCRRRKLGTQELINIIKFRHTLLNNGKQSETNQSTQVLVDSNAFENPGFNSEQDAIQFR